MKNINKLLTSLSLALLGGVASSMAQTAFTFARTNSRVESVTNTNEIGPTRCFYRLATPRRP